MRLYWETHDRKWAHIGYSSDPDGLQNVCHAGEARWLDEYYARFQRRVYESLLVQVPAARPGSRALDVGCGAGRWCRILTERGYEAVGIDLQPELLERNRLYLPNIEFTRSAIQGFCSSRAFDLGSSVSVLQHLPFGEQLLAVRPIRELIKEGRLVIALENIADHGHVFANSIAQWRALFSSCSFKCLGMRRYDYSPFTLITGALRRIAGAIARKQSDDRMNANGRSTSSRGLRVQNGMTWIGVTLDAAIESLLVGLDLSLHPRCIAASSFEAS
jgi:2-polyprenyl-3-methyl-5-hydroxy-6-metoxy-1,4-benzoquinol methylase